MPVYLPIASSVSIGSIIMHGSTTIPDSYLDCDGSAISRTTFSDLFAIIGTTYGVGDGSTTFNVPDLRQRFPLGKSPSGTGSTLGGTGGNIDHLHTVDPPSTVTSAAPSQTVGILSLLSTAAPAGHTHTVDIAAFNSGTNNPPFQTVKFIIRSN